MVVGHGWDLKNDEPCTLGGTGFFDGIGRVAYEVCAWVVKIGDAS